MVTGERKNSCTNVWIIFKIQIGMEGQRHSGTPEGTTRNLYMTLILSRNVIVTLQFTDLCRYSGFEKIKW